MIGRTGSTCSTRLGSPLWRWASCSSRVSSLGWPNIGSIGEGLWAQMSRATGAVRSRGHSKGTLGNTIDTLEAGHFKAIPSVVRAFVIHARNDNKNYQTSYKDSGNNQ